MTYEITYHDPNTNEDVTAYRKNYQAANALADKLHSEGFTPSIKIKSVYTYQQQVSQNSAPRYKVFYRKPGAEKWTVTTRPTWTEALECEAEFRRNGYEAEACIPTAPLTHKNYHPSRRGKYEPEAIDSSLEEASGALDNPTRRTVFNACWHEHSNTTASFISSFEERMTKETGNCTEDDIQYAKRRLFYMAEKEICRVEKKFGQKEISHETEPER